MLESTWEEGSLDWRESGRDSESCDKCSRRTLGRMSYFTDKRSFANKPMCQRCALQMLTTETERVLGSPSEGREPWLRFRE